MRFQAYSPPGPEAASSCFHALQEARIVLQSIVKPIVLGLEPDQHTRGPAVPRDYNLLLLGKLEVS
jgi:hypothetical protein